MKFLLTTATSTKRFFITAPENRNRRYFITSGKKNLFRITKPEKRNARFFITASKKNLFFITSPLEDTFNECCKYPTWVELMREEAIYYVCNNYISVLTDSIYKESFGKNNSLVFTNFYKLNSLIDYLSTISIKMREDENSGIDNDVEYYYSTYSLNCIIDYFKCQNINIKPIIEIFNINTYTPLEYNFEAFDFAYNIEIEDTTVNMKSFRNYYTNQSLTPATNEAVNSISGGQTSFTTTHNIYSISSFIINGNDKTDRIDFSGNTVTYTSGGTYPYVIQSTDTVIINYTYES